jgi:hypothetical protein
MAALLEVELPPMPVRAFGHGDLFQDGNKSGAWGMLGNDRAGDCFFAGADHETMLFNKLRRRILGFNDRVALEDYRDVTGYNIITGENDEGTYVRDGMSYRRKTGLIDIYGARHKIDAYIQIDAKDWDTMIKAVWTFGVVGIGFEFPDKTAWSEFDAGKPWSLTTQANPNEGHYVPIVGSKSPAYRATCITWGKRQEMTREFYEAYNDEAWVPLSHEAMLASGFNTRHINWQTLQAILGSL